jgi:hypothetical protein
MLQFDLHNQVSTAITTLQNKQQGALIIDVEAIPDYDSCQ